jgi:hypothetical protein
MGCISSQPVVVVWPPEPLPQWKDLSDIKVERIPREPFAFTEDQYNCVSEKEPLFLIFRQIAASNKGNSFQVETLEDALFHKLRIDPAKPNMGIQNRLEDLMYIYQEYLPQGVISYSIKDVNKGLNHYLLLKNKSLYDKQKPTKFENPNLPGKMYRYASLEFDPQEKVGKITTVFSPPDIKKGEPAMTLHQCNPKVWVLKRRRVNNKDCGGSDGAQICAVFNQWRGSGTRFTCWRVMVCAGEDPILASLVAHCIDSFLPVAKQQCEYYCLGVCPSFPPFCI